MISQDPDIPKPLGIVDELRKIQEEAGYLSKAEMHALAERYESQGIRVPLHRIHEVASFYPMYRLEPPPIVDIRICRDMACHLHGGGKMIENLQTTFAREIAEKKVFVEGVSCLGQCDGAVACMINDHHYYFPVTEKELEQKVQEGLSGRHFHDPVLDNTPLPWDIDVYKGQPTYDAVQRFCKGELTTEEILKRLEVSGLRGLGGAGFPTFRKWSAVRGCPGPAKYIVCNADESEPGTFKDRELLRRTPWLTLEGMILAALVVGARQGYLYIRHEYPRESEAFQRAIDDAYNKYKVLGKNILGTQHSFDLHLYISPGGYVQGEESALLEAIEDKRGEPRNKPPFPVFEGLFGKPTVINNVETLAWTPGIMMHGGEWYKNGGLNGYLGRRFISISGDVNKPGVYESGFGLTVRDLVMGLAGGMRGKQTLKAIAPSGPSGGFVPATLKKAMMSKGFQDKFMQGKDTYDLLDLPLDNGVLSMAGSMLGAAFVVYGSDCDIVECALNCVEFFRNESCGKCVPCRTGSQKLVNIIGEELLKGRYAGSADRVAEGRKRLTLVNDLAETMVITSICGLGQVASNPIASVLRFFQDDVDRYLKNGQ
jgi:NADH:ubiquinone oxidoreductase subunit F (NADH-binding)/NADH:ubiquinone oxidoreductase subunit E